MTGLYYEEFAFGELDRTVLSLKMRTRREGE